MIPVRGALSQDADELAPSSSEVEERVGLGLEDWHLEALIDGWAVIRGRRGCARRPPHGGEVLWGRSGLVDHELVWPAGQRTADIRSLTVGLGTSSMVGEVPSTKLVVGAALGPVVEGIEKVLFTVDGLRGNHRVALVGNGPEERGTRKASRGCGLREAIPVVARGLSEGVEGAKASAIFRNLHALNCILSCYLINQLIRYI